MPRKVYTEEFKREAVRLAKEPGVPTVGRWKPHDRSAPALRDAGYVFPGRDGQRAITGLNLRFGRSLRGEGIVVTLPHIDDLIARKSVLDQADGVQFRQAVRQSIMIPAVVMYQDVDNKQTQLRLITGVFVQNGLWIDRVTKAEIILETEVSRMISFGFPPASRSGFSDPTRNWSRCRVPWSACHGRRSTSDR